MSSAVGVPPPLCSGRFWIVLNMSPVPYSIKTVTNSNLNPYVTRKYITLCPKNSHHVKMVPSIPGSLIPPQAFERHLPLFLWGFWKNAKLRLWPEISFRLITVLQHAPCRTTISEKRIERRTQRATTTCKST